MERQTIAHCQLGVAGKESWTREEREGGHRNCLTVHTQKEMGEREALLMIIFLTPRKMTAITPACGRSGQEEAGHD